MSSGDDDVVARHVVVATDPVTAAQRTSQAVPTMHGVVTDWWATEEVTLGPSMLWVDSRPDPGPVLNTAIISAVAPTYAPAGQHLIQVSALVAPDGAAPSESVLRRHAADILGVDGKRWNLLVRNVIRHALPAQPPPLRVRRPIHTTGGPLGVR